MVNIPLPHLPHKAVEAESVPVRLSSRHNSATARLASLFPSFLPSPLYRQASEIPGLSHVSHPLLPPFLHVRANPVASSVLASVQVQHLSLLFLTPSLLDFSRSLRSVNMQATSHPLLQASFLCQSPYYRLLHSNESQDIHFCTLVNFEVRLKFSSPVIRSPK